MDTKYILLTLLFLTVIFNIYFFYPSLQNEKGEIPAKPIATIDKGNFSNGMSIKDTSTKNFIQDFSEEKKHLVLNKSISPARIKTTLVHSERYKNYQIPKNNLADFVEKLKLKAEFDSTGTTDYRLFRALSRCNNVVVSESELLDKIHKLNAEDRNDGSVFEDVLREEKWLRQSFKQCEGIPLDDREKWFEYLSSAAEKGLTRAQVAFSGVLPKNYETWEEEERNNFQQKVWNYLFQARKQCDPDAFSSLALRYEMVEGETGIIESYAHTYATRIILANHYIGTEEVVSNTDKILEGLNYTIYAFQKEEAKSKGIYYYHAFCS